MFIDRANIFVKSGRGGDGIVAFHREKYVNAGGPDGGDGGKGGDIIFTVDTGMSTLMDFRYKRKFAAQNGENGRKNKMTGKSGQDLIVKVPQGTVVKNADTDEVIADLTDKDQRVVIAKGGRGGQGNMHFATSTRQIPNFARAGHEGVELNLKLELKLLADVGLVGYPNVGKSTLLSVCTAAKPEIADYHFTTIVPNLGVVFNEGERSFAIADIPGLIEGASSGLGLGHEFLRHIERTRLIVHVIDVSGSEGRDPFDDFIKINEELMQFSKDLAEKPQIIALNKTDIDSDKVNEFKNKYAAWVDENSENITETYENGAWKIFEISAATNTGVSELMAYCGSILDKMPNKQMNVTIKEEVTLHKAQADEELFTIRVENNVYIVEGNWIKNVVESTNLEDYESMAYFQRIIRKKGLIDALVAKGIKENDTVKIYDIEFDYVE